MSAVTPYPDVNFILNTLLAGVRTILGHDFVGLYLYGSLSSGDFDPLRSDVDFVVVTTDQLPAELISALEEMHKQLTASGLKWALKLEGTYIPQSALRRYDPKAAPCPCLNEGRFYMAQHGSDWSIQRHVLREWGVVVAGPPIRPLIDPVQPDDLRQGVRGVLHGWWAALLNDPTWLRDGEYQAFAVLTMCRALYTFRHGTIASKPASARWALTTLDRKWTPLIEWAINWRHADQSERLSETLDFIRYTLERSDHDDLSDHPIG
jgi:hypothetical protein